MATERIEVNYESLDQVSGMFDERHAKMTEMLQDLNCSMEALRGDGWIGRGSEAFYCEMEEDLLPRVKRLCEALAEAQRITRQIAQTMEDAEQEAGQCLRV